MNQKDARNLNVLHLGCLAFFLVFGWFSLLHDVGFNLSDEGYLWNNAILTFYKYVPIRDFRSYDPGRYYWEAMWFFLLGPNLFAHRFSIALVQFIGLFAGLLALRKIVKNYLYILPCATILLFFLHPREKVFEASFVLVALFCATHLVEKTRQRHYFISGIVVGFAAFWAKNIGLYFAVGFFCLILFLSLLHSRQPLWPNVKVWMLGIVAGYFPMIIMCSIVPGFWQSFMDANLRLFNHTAPIKPLPVPWPRLNDIFDNSKEFLLGLTFVLMFSFYSIALPSVFYLRNRCSPLFIAATFIGIPILHHASVRADYNHVAISVSPFVLVVIAMGYSGGLGNRLRPLVRYSSFVVLIVFLSLTVYFSNEIRLGWESVKMRMNLPSLLEPYKVQNEYLYITRRDAVFIRKVQQCFGSGLKSSDEIFVAPYFPGLYFFFNKRSPIWDAFPIHTASFEEQKKEIEQLKGKSVRWALVSDAPLDGIAERRFRFTHPLVWQHLQEHFILVECQDLLKGQQLLRAKK